MLTKILAHKRTEIAGLDEAALRRAALDTPRPRPFLPPGPRDTVGLIAEIKRASPSRGLLAPHLNLEAIARLYADNGASAISVLTDSEFFLGQLEYLAALRQATPALPPLLRKDFIINRAQLYQTRAAGADAVLLIAAALTDDAELADLHALALELGLTPLVEVHTEDELMRVLHLPNLRLVGINNRDLGTFNIALTTTERLRPLVPAAIPVVAESGIFTAADVARLAQVDVAAVLVGEALVTAPDIAAKVRELSGVATCTSKSAA
ncbi:MAG: indole-3-glycerol phosphate synthase TrpC [Anaerolineales bacterium]|nr:indole-3-glycerol phosphate synthase TrpC [Anaerolineales bacterium]